MSDTGKTEDQRWYGRRYGRKLRPRRQGLVDGLLPKLRVGLDVDPAALFGSTIDDLWMEIGFGGGEHLAGQALRHPHTGFIGCEPFVNGVASLLAQIDDAGIQNIRIYDDDARPLVASLPDGCLSRLYVLYSDPWPKVRHHRRRLTAEANIDQFARLLRPGAEFRFATDHAEFAAWTLERVLRHPGFSWPVKSPADWRMPPADWIETRYEGKAKAKGLKPVYLTFIRALEAGG